MSILQYENGSNYDLWILPAQYRMTNYSLKILWRNQSQNDTKQQLLLYEITLLVPSVHKNHAKPRSINPDLKLFNSNHKH
jgi:hypothetical protein